MKKVFFVFGIAIVAFTSAANAGSPKTDKTTDAVATPTETKTTGPVVKWFHFNGDANSPSDLNDPSMYSAESSPQCSSTLLAYRCDLQILSNEDQSEPDLTKTAVAESKRSTAQ